MVEGLTGGEPGYCACCRQFHLLTLREIPPLDAPLPVCRECISLGDGEMAWRISKYEPGQPPRRRRRSLRRDRRLAESLIIGDAGGFGKARREVRLRALIAWQRERASAWAAAFRRR
jgi:hypothetical protein